jgi:hypothetical protein
MHLKIQHIILNHLIEVDGQNANFTIFNYGLKINKILDVKCQKNSYILHLNLITLDELLHMPYIEF